MPHITPKYLYKILSDENWRVSQNKKFLRLSTEDNDFIHFAQEDQLDRIISKYWANVSKFVVLKIDTAKLPGQIKFEANPGGTNKYFHLYNGSIPLDAVVETRLASKK